MSAIAVGPRSNCGSSPDRANVKFYFRFAWRDSPAVALLGEVRAGCFEGESLGTTSEIRFRKPAGSKGSAFDRRAFCKHCPVAEPPRIRTMRRRRLLVAPLLATPFAAGAQSLFGDRAIRMIVP